MKWRKNLPTQTDGKMIEVKHHFIRQLDEAAQIEELSPLLAWWRSAGAPPAVSELSPFVIPRQLLPNTALIDVEREPRRFQIRLMGTALADHFGGDATGRHIDELFAPSAYDFIGRQLNEAVDRATPHFAGRVFLTRDGKEMSFSRLVLPLTDTPGQVVRLISTSLPTTPMRTHSDIYRQARRSVVVSPDRAPLSAPRTTTRLSSPASPSPRAGHTRAG